MGSDGCNLLWGLKDKKKRESVKKSVNPFNPVLVKSKLRKSRGDQYTENAEDAEKNELFPCAQ